MHFIQNVNSFARALVCFQKSKFNKNLLNNNNEKKRVLHNCIKTFDNNVILKKEKYIYSGVNKQFETY